METIHADGTPLADYLEGEGYLEPSSIEDDLPHDASRKQNTDSVQSSFLDCFVPTNFLTSLKNPSHSNHIRAPSSGSVSRLHHAWSSAVNSRLGRADNERFLEHFRYLIVASQLLNEYLDQGSIAPSSGTGIDGSTDTSVISSVPTSVYGAAVTAVVAFSLVYLIHWARSGHYGWISKSRVAWALLGLTLVAFVGYQFMRRQWLNSVRRNAVVGVSDLTANWQSFEVSTSTALSLIQEVELVSKGYRLSTPLPPASRVEDQPLSRRCGRLRKALHKAYAAAIPAAIDTCSRLRSLIEEDDLDRYYDVYDISPQDARDASGDDALSVLEDDPDSLKSLRVLSFRAGVLRRVTLCSLMALEADGGKTDFYRWRVAIDAMAAMSRTVGTASEKIRSVLDDMETIQTPISTPTRTPNPQTRDKFRSQVRKISALSSGIRALQAKMQILREETTRSIENADDTTDFGPNLLAQYDSIGSDLRDLQHAWEVGRASLQTNLSKRESDRISNGIGRPISTSTAARSSPVSSIGGLTAVEEGVLLGDSPAGALHKLNGTSDHSSMATTPSNSDEEVVFEAVALPRQRRSMGLPGSIAPSREERIAKMHEERERQASLKARREANTSMLRELESVISLRPNKRASAGGGEPGQARVTSV